MSKREILVHACCAICSGYVLQKLITDYNPIIYYYNPNIFPEEEYIIRRDGLKNYAFTQNIPFIEENYDPIQWMNDIKGLEKEPEKGLRCQKCFYLRLQKTASYAQQNKIGMFTTTLTVSPHKKSGDILRIGSEIASDFSLSFLPEDFKKKDGFKKTIEIAKSMNFYRQTYCGCLFSKS